jgi:hypothetical protein
MRRLSWHDLNDDERAYVTRERREIRAWLLFMAAAVIVALFMLGADGDDSLNGCAVPNCEEAP